MSEFSGQVAAEYERDCYRRGYEIQVKESYTNFECSQCKGYKQTFNEEDETTGQITYKGKSPCPHCNGVGYEPKLDPYAGLRLKILALEGLILCVLQHGYRRRKVGARGVKPGCALCGKPEFEYDEGCPMPELQHIADALDSRVD